MLHDEKKPGLAGTRRRTETQPCYRLDCPLSRALAGLRLSDFALACLRLDAEGGCEPVSLEQILLRARGLRVRRGRA